LQARHLGDTSGQTSEVDVSDQLSIEVGTKLRGSAQTSRRGTRGLSPPSHQLTDFGTEVEPRSDEAVRDRRGRCVKSSSSSLLSSHGHLGAWIRRVQPAAPWCMTWQVSRRPWRMGTGGLCAPPASGKSKVVGGSGGGQEEGTPRPLGQGSSYSIQGAHGVEGNGWERNAIPLRRWICSTRGHGVAQRVLVSSSRLRASGPARGRCGRSRPRIPSRETRHPETGFRECDLDFDWPRPTLRLF